MIHIFTRFKIRHKIYITSFLSLQMVKLIRSSKDSISILVSRPGASRYHIEKQEDPGDKPDSISWHYLMKRACSVPCAKY